MPRDGSGIYSAPAGTTTTPSTTIESAKYNALVADIVADLNAPRPISAGGTGASSLTGFRAAINAQEADALLTALAALVTSANKLPYFTGVDTVAMADITAAARTFLAAATTSAQRSAIGALALTDLNAAAQALLAATSAATQRTAMGAQAQDAALDDIAGMSLVAGDVIYHDGTNLVRLPKGTAGQTLTINSGATAPEWADSSVPTTVGAVGTYAMLQYNSTGTVAAGATKSGSVLNYANADGGASGGPGAGTTWRSMGFADGGGSLGQKVTLWLRIS